VTCSIADICCSRSNLDSELRSNKYGLIKVRFSYPRNPARSSAVPSATSCDAWLVLQVGLQSHNRNLKRVALFTLVFFSMNVLVSGLLLFLPQADINYGIGCVVAL
jgi:hypothetical protein